GLLSIHRIALPSHQSGFLDQARAFATYFFKVRKAIRGQKYDAVFATSSRLLTGFLGALIARKQRCPFFLEFRDIFTETLDSILKAPLKWVLLPIFKAMERYTLNTATHLNLVSEGFKPYFAGRVRAHCTVSYISNGIDECFQGVSYEKKQIRERPQILYTGNMGEGQGLEKIIPGLAKAFPECDFSIIGSGGREAVLKSACQGLTNVRIESPIPRQALIDRYREADVLFLHLNNYPAFQRVLPSKIFEYALTGKRILAGVPGYAAELVSTIPGSWIFPPCDLNAGIQNLKALLDSKEPHFDRTAFCTRFDRRKLMDELAHQFMEMSA
ncbi:MAG: glycosyltransferase WbuB, partial [Gammaproteobacteria bacterium]|nr:glycosyltransferase WbuB [Gammaproteobacteria bacterium]